MNNKQPQAEKTTDAVKPKKSTGEASQVVLTNRSVIHSPQATTDNTEADKPASPAASRPKRIVISPISPEDHEEPKEDEAKGIQQPTTKATAAPEPTAPPSSLDEVKLPEDDKPTKTDAATQEENPDKPSDETLKAVEAAAKRERELQEYIDSHQFFVPLNTEERKRSIKVSFGLTFLLFVLGVLLIDLMLDSGIIELIQKIPHTHFFTS